MTILDIMDFVSNSVLMPIVAFFTAIFVGFIIKPKSISDEVRVTNGKICRGKIVYRDDQMDHPCIFDIDPWKLCCQCNGMV